jgi:glucose/arabinose dehydrogenase
MGLAPLVSACAADTAAAPVPGTGPDQAALRVETLVSGLDTPWDLAWGPDDYLWVTERGGRISRVNPASGAIAQVGHIDVLERGESGLMGMAFHPSFESEPYVYVAHSYRSGAGTRNRLVRLRYEGGSLGQPETLLEAIPGARNHDGARLAFGPDGFLYMTTGDAGQASSAQELGSLAGKVLRLTPEGAPAPGNPFGSPVFSYGHRNPQGLVFHPVTGVLYSAEHGPSDNDEVNLILARGDYGWPDVRGYCDGDSSREDAYCEQNEVVEPLSAWTPTVGISGLDIYTSDVIPGWKESLLATSLRGGTLFRLRLAPDGERVVEREALLENEYGRLRDVLVPAADDDRILRIGPSS